MLYKAGRACFPNERKGGLIWSHMHIMNKHSVDFVSQARNEKDLQHQENLKSIYNIINMGKTDQRLSACRVHYRVQALGWVGGCFREKRHHVFRIILTSHQVDMQTEQGESWQKQPSLLQAPTSVKHRLVCSVKVMHRFILADKHLHIHPAVELPKRRTKTKHFDDKETSVRKAPVLLSKNILCWFRTVSPLFLFSLPLLLYLM